MFAKQWCLYAYTDCHYAGEVLEVKRLWLNFIIRVIVFRVQI